MTAAASVPGFVASQRGFRFTNSFPPEPTIRIDLGPAGTVGLGDASQGLCGGMAFAVRDYFEAGLPVPSDDTPPAAETPLFHYLVRRLVDSFDLPGGVARYALWMALPSGDIEFFGMRERGTAYRTAHSSWPAVQADIDAGHPSALGLVTVHTADVRQIGRCHQVLAYGYSVDDSAVTLSVYDPNTVNEDADGVWIRLPLDGGVIEQNVNIGENTLHGFFRSRYSVRMPPR
jgi:hypothetical protein